MKISDLFMETFSAFSANKARTLLTLLGIVIGISAVISMTAIIGGMKTSLVSEMGLSQARLVEIFLNTDQGMTTADLQDMSNDLKGYFEYLIPQTSGSAEVSSSTEKATGYITGVSADHATVNGMKVVQGRFISQKEADSASLVVVLDESGAKKLFGASATHVVGNTVRIGSSEYEIVGILESSTLDTGDSVSLYMPFKTCSQRINGTTTFSTLLGLTYEEIEPQQAADAATNWLVERFRIPEKDKEDAIYVLTMKSIIDSLNTFMAAFQALMTLVASISLLVGGIGIMNMMLTNVTERIREIGLRKALGARRRDITRQFLLESILITLAGGAIGVVLGYLVAFALSSLVGAVFEMQGVNITPTIGFDTVALVTFICVLIGVVFGYYPARRAAKLDPVESLRYQ